MLVLVTLLAVLTLAFANGANDNFKGVATLFGSGAAGFRTAVAWGTITTFLGSLAAVLLAQQLLKSFSGRGLVDAAIVSDLRYVSAVALAAGATVLLATRFGLPVSTTHGLIGALVGAGWAAGSAVNASRLAVEFLAPMLISPVVSLSLTCLLYPALSLMRRGLGVTRETCVCLGDEIVEVLPDSIGTAAYVQSQKLTAAVQETAVCRDRYQGRVVGCEAATIVDWLHFFSAGIVSFARGLNDTPKIAALLLLLPAVGNWYGIALVAVAMAIGGLVNVRRVAETMSRQITPMNHGQGFTANLVTGLIVIGASRLGMPVSTTHVSCGSLFGIGLISRQGQLGTVSRILAAWVTTLPLATVLGAAVFSAIQRLN